MSRSLGEQSLKVTMNFYLSDIEYIKDRYGYGWSEMIRLFLREKVIQLKKEDERGK